MLALRYSFIVMKALYIRIEDNEHKAIQAEAKKLGISVSAFVRLLLKNWSDGIKFEQVPGKHTGEQSG